MIDTSDTAGRPAAGDAALWPGTRAAGLARLAAFLPRAGQAYAADRNVDRGPHDRSNVSGLSPYLRRRIVTETEVIEAVVAHHGLAAPEKFVQEVLWRTYWKGWLEQRPALWVQTIADTSALHAAVIRDPARAAGLAAATAGTTGIACFDAWVQELVTSGWLHNHSRMWFASIWIFTLGLPWQLGADLFQRHLLDADPASNTLSWRWVAGLHTRGKHYLARADNIARNTGFRFNPAGQLDEAALPMSEAVPPPPARPIPPAGQPRASRFALLLNEEDLHPESWALTGSVAAIGLLAQPKASRPDSPAARFAAEAQADALARAEAHFGRPGTTLAPEAVLAWARAHDVHEIVTGYAPVGPTADLLAALARPLAEAGVRLVALRRDWDTRCWPHATAGFFRMRAALPDLVAPLMCRTRA